jgi:hypothetical protein
MKTFTNGYWSRAECTRAFKIAARLCSTLRNILRWRSELRSWKKLTFLGLELFRGKSFSNVNNLAYGVIVKQGKTQFNSESQLSTSWLVWVKFKPLHVT